MRKDLGPKTWLTPMPVLIIGTYDENGKADAMNAAWGGIYDTNQITVSLASHRTTTNIRNQKAFTISFATRKTVEASDYVGIVSQNRVPDKMARAHLHDIKSNHVNAPLFEEYPLTLECKLISLDGSEGEGGTLIGEIVNVSVDESILTNDKVDLKKLDPICFDCINNKYVALGEDVANAFKIGLNLK